jgi:hypothetical protein
MTSAFWDSHDPDEYKSGGFLSESDIDKLISQGTVLYVIGVGDVEAGQFGDRRVVVFGNGDGSGAMKSFSVRNKDGADVFPSRAKQLADMAAWLADGGESIPVRFYAAGQAYGLEAVT